MGFGDFISGVGQAILPGAISGALKALILQPLASPIVFLVQE